MNKARPLTDARILTVGLGILSSPAIAHEGHTLDLFSAFVAPLAGWDHLLMAGLFVAVIVGMVRAMRKAVRRKTSVHRSDNE